MNLLAELLDIINFLVQNINWIKANLLIDVILFLILGSTIKDFLYIELLIM